MNQNGNSLTTLLLATGLAGLFISPIVIGKRLIVWLGRAGALAFLSVFMTIVAMLSGYFINEAEQLRQSCGTCIASLMSLPLIEFGKGGFWLLAIFAWLFTILYMYLKYKDGNNECK